jgi:hypothetical protein
VQAHPLGERKPGGELSSSDSTWSATACLDWKLTHHRLSPFPTLATSNSNSLYHLTTTFQDTLEPRPPHLSAFCNPLLLPSQALTCPAALSNSAIASSQLTNSHLPRTTVTPHPLITTTDPTILSFTSYVHSCSLTARCNKAELIGADLRPHSAEQERRPLPHQRQCTASPTPPTTTATLPPLHTRPLPLYPTSRIFPRPSPEGGAGAPSRLRRLRRLAPTSHSFGRA